MMKNKRRTLSLYCLTIISLICICAMMFMMNVVMIQTAKAETTILTNFEEYCERSLER